MGGGKGFLTALGRIDVGVCYTRRARSRRWCRWWGKRGRWGGGVELEQRRRGGVSTGLGRIYVGACYTCGARSRRWPNLQDEMSDDVVR